MKLSAFIAGVFGVLGFALSILAGLIADNSIDSILIKAIFCAVICYVVGYIVGMMAEHAQKLAKRVADSDAAELLAAEEKAELDNPSTSAPNGETAATLAGVPGK
jgi:uncharacterized membrane protein